MFQHDRNAVMIVISCMMQTDLLNDIICICLLYTSLKMTAKKYGQTIVMITHDDEIAQVADRILVIEDGQVVDFN